MIVFFYLIKTYFLFIFFSLIISIFGSIFVYILQKLSIRKWHASILEKGFISYAIGLIIYMQWAYILNLFKLFNFFSIILPLLILSFTFAFFLYKKKLIQEYLTQLKEYINSNKKSVAIDCLILSTTFIFQFLIFWPKVSESTALFAIDPYLWTKSILYLNKNGIVDYIYLEYRYPWGFVFICGGNLLISPDLVTTYYFMKFACFPYLNFYILVMFSISKRVFKRPSLILFSLLSIFANTFFLFRIILFISSAIPVLLILISYVIVITKSPYYLFGFIIPATLLINPVYTLFFLLAVSIFFILKVIISARIIFSILIQIIAIILLSFIFIIPHFINIYFFFKYDLFEIIRRFYWMFRNSYAPDALINVFRHSSLEIILINSFYLIISDISLYIGELMLSGLIYGILIPFSIIGLFLNNNAKEGNYKDFVIFIKIGLILLLIIAFLLQLVERNFFFYIFNFRIIEAFYPCIIFPAGFFLERILKVFEEKWEKRKFNYNNFDGFILFK